MATQKEIIEKAKECLLFKHSELGYNQKDIEFIKWLIKESQEEVFEYNLYSLKSTKHLCQTEMTELYNIFEELKRVLALK